MNLPLALTKTTALLAMAALTGCLPLQQAPLVYSSKVTVGMDVSGTATEQPGVSVNIGYKQVDAAYVPVAVAKPCDAKELSAGENCTSKTYELQEIKGRNAVGDSKVPRSALEAAEKKIRAFKQASLDRENAETELKDLARKRDELAARLAAYAADKKAELATADSHNGTGTADAADKVFLTERTAKQTAVAAADAAVAAGQAKKKTADDAFRNADVSGLAEAFSLVGGENNKTDAYSVFGSFDANTKARVEVGKTTAVETDVALVIGKVFSTGVASQNLTEGMRTYYAGAGASQVERARSDCLLKGATLFSEYKLLVDATQAAGKKELKEMAERLSRTCSIQPTDAQLRDATK